MLRLLRRWEGGIEQKHLSEQKVDFPTCSIETAPNLWQGQPLFHPCFPSEFLGNGPLRTAQRSWKDEHQNLQSRSPLQERKADLGTESSASANLQEKIHCVAGGLWKILSVYIRCLRERKTSVKSLKIWLKWSWNHSPSWKITHSHLSFGHFCYIQPNIGGFKKIPPPLAMHISFASPFLN